MLPQKKRETNSDGEDNLTSATLAQIFRYAYQQNSRCVKYRSTLKKTLKVRKLCKFYVMLYMITTGMKKEGKIQNFISEKKIWEAGEPFFYELRKNGNAISKEEKNCYV